KLQALQSHSVINSNLKLQQDEKSDEQLRQVQALQALKEKMEIQWSPSLCIDTAEKQKTEEKQPVEEELEELRAKLKWTKGELEAWREAQRQRQLQVGGEETPSWTTSTTHDAHVRTAQDENPEGGRGPEAVVPGSRNTAASDPGMDTQVGCAVLGSQAEDWDHWLSVDQAALWEWRFRASGRPRWLSSVAEPEDSRDGPQKVLAALRRTLTLLKQFRPVLEDALEEKRESLGIKRDDS
ncbi:hypothetical protein MC885_005936, partial [Smutsia gigantea]